MKMDSKWKQRHTQKKTLAYLEESGLRIHVEERVVSVAVPIRVDADVAADSFYFFSKKKSIIVKKKIQNWSRMNFTKKSFFVSNLKK